MRLFTGLVSSFLLMGGMSLQGTAQITLGSSWLLDAGYNAELLIDENYTDPQGNLAKSGGNQRWEFRNLDRDGRFNIEVKRATEGSAADSFPDADLVMRTGRSIGLAGSETDLYLRRTQERIEVVGLADDASIIPVVRLPQPLDLFRVPLTFNSTGSDNFLFRLTFGKEFLLLLGLDSTALTLVDSVGFSLRQNVSFRVDGWGEIITPDLSADALRVRTVTESGQDLEVKVPPFGWVPISRFIQVPDSVFQNGAARSVDYSWVIADESYPLVSLFVDNNDQPSELTYNARTVSSLVELAPQAKLKAYTQGEQLNIETLMSQGGSGMVEVLGPDGRRVFSADLQLQGGSISTSTAQWPSGMYLIALWQDGRLIGTQRLMNLR